MYKYFLILIFLSLELFGMKIRLIQNDDIIKTKLILKNKMISEEEAKKENTKSEYITNITAKIDGKTIYNISTSPYMAYNPYLTFKFDNKFTSKEFEIYTTDNMHQQKMKNIKIDKFKNNKITSTEPATSVKYQIENDFRVLNPKVWKIKKPEDALKNLFGSTNGAEGIIKIKTPKYVEYGVAPINIKSNIHLETIAIFIEGNPYPTTAIFSIPMSSTIDYDIRVKLTGDRKLIIGQVNCIDYNIIVMGKDTNSKLYKTEQKTAICIAN